MPSASVSLPAPGSTVPRARAHGFERLPLWSNAWRLAVVWVLGLVLFLFYVTPMVMMAEVPGGSDSVETAGTAAGLMLLDLLVGQLVVALAAFRRRFPFAVAATTMLLTSVSVFAVPAAYLTVLSLATRRRLGQVVWLGVLNLLTGLAFEQFVTVRTMPPEFRGITGQGWLVDVLIYTVIVTLFFGVVALIGWNIGSRRELHASWRGQADTANREQAARVAQAQLAERARIAREMHDVLAHRLSLVAMHAGVLAHRPDLPEEERAEAAEVVRAGTHQALEELREVLGVLRAQTDGGGADKDGAPGRVEEPQPGLSGIPALVAEATSGGQEVRLVAEEDLWPRSVGLPTSTGRHAYRLVQEALTNARKHAAGAPVAVKIGGGPEQGLTLVVSNGTTPGQADLPSGGRGLVGMAERAELAGGRFDAGPEGTDFVARVWLPWPRKGVEDG